MAAEMSGILKEYYDTTGDSTEMPSNASNSGTITIYPRQRRNGETVESPEQAGGSNPYHSTPKSVKHSTPKKVAGASAEQSRPRAQTDYRTKYNNLKLTIKSQDEQIANLNSHISKLNWCLDGAEKKLKKERETNAQLHSRNVMLTAKLRRSQWTGVANDAKWKSRGAAWQQSYMKLEKKNASLVQLYNSLFNHMEEHKAFIAKMKPALSKSADSSLESLFEDSRLFSLRTLDRGMLDITGVSTVSSPASSVQQQQPETPNISFDNAM